MLPKNSRPPVETAKLPPKNKKPLKSYLKVNVASFAVVGSLLSFATFQVGTDLAQSLQVSQPDSGAVISSISGQASASTPTPAPATTAAAIATATAAATPTSSPRTPAATTPAVSTTTTAATTAAAKTTPAATTTTAAASGNNVTVSQVTKAAAPVVTKRS